MKNRIFLFLISVACFMPLMAQKAVDFPITLTVQDGLCDKLDFSFEDYQNHYFFSSPLYRLEKEVKCLRFTVPETTSMDSGGGYPCFALAEFFIYDKNGKEVKLNASNFSTNAQEPNEGPMEYICDRNYATFFHSLWSHYDSSTGEHYIDVTLPTPLKEFSFSYISRYENVAPTKIIVEDAYQVDEDKRREEEEQEHLRNHRDSITVSISETNPGYEWDLSFDLGSTDEYIRFTALQLELDMPAQFTKAGVNFTFEPNGERLTDHQIAGGNISENTVRIIVYSPTNDLISGIGGTLFTAHLTTSYMAQPGKHSITVKNIHLTTGEHTDRTLKSVKTTLSSTDPNAPVKYDVTPATNIEHGSIYISKKSAVKGDKVSVTAFPDAGYQLDHWEIDGVTPDDPTAKSTKFTMPAHDVVVGVVFKPIPDAIHALTPDATTPDSSTSDASARQAIYDLSGRPVTTPLVPGRIYIVNGKKHIAR